MTTKDRLLGLLLDHKKSDVVVDEERLKLLLGPEGVDAEVDWEEVQDALGYSSLQMLAFLRSVNAEFGTDLTADSFMTIKGTDGLIALLD